jgi:hypothetical protein
MIFLCLVDVLLFGCSVVLLLSRAPALPPSSPCSRGPCGHTSHSFTVYLKSRLYKSIIFLISTKIYPIGNSPNRPRGGLTINSLYSGLNIVSYLLRNLSIVRNYGYYFWTAIAVAKPSNSWLYVTIITSGFIICFLIPPKRSNLWTSACLSLLRIGMAARFCNGCNIMARSFYRRSISLSITRRRANKVLRLRIFEIPGEEQVYTFISFLSCLILLLSTSHFTNACVRGPD